VEKGRLGVSDEVDLAAEYMDRVLQTALDAHTRANRMKPVGACYYCEAELKSGMLFCDADCRDEYERMIAAQRRNR